MKVGDELPPLTIPVTRTLIVAGAVASRDYQDVHHDAELAKAKGSPDIFMNILTTNGLVGRYITDHLGERAVLRKVAIRLGAPNYPGDTMVLTGSVSAIEGNTVEIRIVGANGMGRHVTGTATITLREGRETRDSRDSRDSRVPPESREQRAIPKTRRSPGRPAGPEHPADPTSPGAAI